MSPAPNVAGSLNGEASAPSWTQGQETRTPTPPTELHPFAAAALEVGGVHFNLIAQSRQEKRSPRSPHGGRGFSYALALAGGRDQDAGMPCSCPSCSAGLRCYRADRDVVLPTRVTRWALWGDLLELAAAVGSDHIREAINKLAPFEFCGVHWQPSV